MLPCMPHARCFALKHWGPRDRLRLLRLSADCVRLHGWGLAMTLLAWVTLAMLALAPGRDHTALASAIADTVEKEGCFVTGANCERRTAALMVSVAFRESTFRLEAVGDQGRSVCSFQILGGSRDLLTDATACALEGHRRLKASLQACRGSIAMYAAGRCDSARGKSIDADRKRLALRILEGR